MNGIIESIDHTHASDENFDEINYLNWYFREAHMKSLHDMEELKRVQGSRFDEFSKRRLIESQDTINELKARIQELQNEVNCLNDPQHALDCPTFPVNQRYSHFFAILAGC